ncbi:MAG: rhomboid family intramembrane serine protease [Kangiellaceae bacterium]|nr:rhomboid family intramembrane serine protease [Kangiellaceae bacterium]|tara:strand:+ start:1697 stop:2263 length:567 start_codon:yes stop_codon:yes gene_type:complete
MKMLSVGARVVLVILGLMWLIHGVALAIDYPVVRYGIYPREIQGLTGIVTAPVLHASWSHLLANSLPFLGLGILVYSVRAFWSATLFIVLVGGLLVWIFGRSAIHIGASGLIMGYFGFLLAYGWYAKQWKPLLVAFITLVCFGGLAFTLLDFRQHISFEGHIFGFIAGLLFARLWSGRRGKKNGRVSR